MAQSSRVSLPVTPTGQQLCNTTLDGSRISHSNLKPQDSSHLRPRLPKPPRLSLRHFFRVKASAVSLEGPGVPSKSPPTRQDTTTGTAFEATSTTFINTSMLIGKDTVPPEATAMVTTTITGCAVADPSAFFSGWRSSLQFWSQFPRSWSLMRLATPWPMSL